MDRRSTRNGAASALVLFDIDGTLIRRAGPHHRQALVEAVRRITGLEAKIDHIPVQGMIDPDILTIMLREAGASTSLIRRSLPAIMMRAQLLYTRTCPDLKRKVCPGARAVLSRLRRAAIPVGLVTGNLSRIGWKKMEHAGLRPYFRFGAFAESAPDRAGLVRLAVTHARSQGWINGDTPISLIGDHPNDVRAAQANGVRSVAVATGLSTEDELRACGPDLLLPDLRGLRLEMLRA